MKYKNILSFHLFIEIYTFLVLCYNVAGIMHINTAILLNSIPLFYLQCASSPLDGTISHNDLFNLKLAICSSYNPTTGGPTKPYGGDPFVQLNLQLSQFYTGGVLPVYPVRHSQR